MGRDPACCDHRCLDLPAGRTVVVTFDLGLGFNVCRYLYRRVLFPHRALPRPLHKHCKCPASESGSHQPGRPLDADFDGLLFCRFGAARLDAAATSRLHQQPSTVVGPFTAAIGVAGGGPYGGGQFDRKRPGGYQSRSCPHDWRTAYLAISVYHDRLWRGQRLSLLGRKRHLQQAVGQRTGCPICWLRRYARRGHARCNRHSGLLCRRRNGTI